MLGDKIKNILNESLSKFCRGVVNANTSFYELAFEELDQLQKDALMFGAITAAYKSDEIESIFMFDGTFMVKYEHCDESDHLDYWYKQQLEKPSNTNG